ncbi:DUF2779 domain-containing protein [Polynucleobacter paneuropaeus]|nr:DUF2779 domain-containing protein [Polynucleobacter paneuropaeus]
MKPRYLTKSRFKLAVECPTKLFYTNKKNYRDLKQEDSFLQALADGGFQVGEFAKYLFPTGILIESKDNAEAEAATSALMAKNDEVILFEPAIRFNDLFIRVDVLIKRQNSFELIEVKAKSYNSVDPQIEGARTPILSGMLPYIQDVAFQKFVLSQKFPDKAIASYLMMPDKAVNATVDGLNQLFKIKRDGRSIDVVVSADASMLIDQNNSLLAKVNVDQYVDIVMRDGIQFPGGHSYLPNLATDWAKSYMDDIKITPFIHAGCAKCEFRSHSGDGYRNGYLECMAEGTGLSEREIEAGTVLDIWNFRGKDKLIDKRIFKLSRVTEEDLKVRNDKDGLSNSQRQWLQCNGIPKEDDLGGFYFDQNVFENLHQQWTYPLHMIDFETSTTALPFFKGMRPYESVAFQFSHHIIEKDGSVRHVGQFICAEPGVFPNFEFVRELKRQLEVDDGTIFRWAAHENTILNHIGAQLQQRSSIVPDANDLLSFILDVTDDGARSMVDLNEIAKRTYFHPETKGRTSIKKVLPAVLRTSQFLKDKYQKPIYGADASISGAIQSLNLKDFTWWELDSGQVADPYGKLKTIVDDMLGDEGGGILDAEELEITEGGAAAMAFGRLQFEDLTDQDRKRIKNALLRYCELDTLAMVMIVEAWKDWTGI